MPRIRRSRDNRMGGAARCSRRHSPRSSKIVEAESRASVSRISIDGLAMSAAAALLDAVMADAIIGLRRCQRETELPFHRAGQEPAHAVLLPVCRLHHLFDARPLRPAEQSEHALLLGHALQLLFYSPNRRFGGGDLRGLRFKRPRRLLGVERRGCDLAPRWRVWFGVPLFGSGALEVPGLFDGKGRHGLGSFGSRRRKRRWHDPKPRTSRGEPRATLSPPARDHTNACYAAEVQSVLRPKIRRRPRYFHGRFAITR